jgi:hypothetical protein
LLPGDGFDNGRKPGLQIQLLVHPQKEQNGRQPQPDNLVDPRPAIVEDAPGKPGRCQAASRRAQVKGNG